MNATNSVQVAFGIVARIGLSLSFNSSQASFFSE